MAEGDSGAIFHGAKSSASGSEVVECVASQEFEEMARRKISEFFGIELRPGTVQDVPKKFDMVSPDKSIVGDAMYYSLVRGMYIPPAKLSTISEHVWLLEKTRSRVNFLVFRNDKLVPDEWLGRYGHLVTDVQFFFIDAETRVVRLR